MPELNGADWQPLLDAFRDADNLGSLISPPPVDVDGLTAQLGAFEASGRQEVSLDAPRLRQLVKQAELLSKPYLAVVANPPYMGGKAFNKTVKDFVDSRFPRGKGDIFAPFIERSLELTADDGFTAAINQHSWMFLSSYESLRLHLLDNFTFKNMLHLGIGVFPELNSKVVQSTAFIIQKAKPKENTSGVYVRLTEKYAPEWKQKTLLNGENQYKSIRQKDFGKIPGNPIAYWVSERVLKTFISFQKLSEIALLKQGLITGNNDRFLRSWFEINTFSLYSSTAQEKRHSKWFWYNKGGDFRRWYGNYAWVVNWENDGNELRTFVDKKGELRSRPQNTQHYFQKGITWSSVSSSIFSSRFQSNLEVFSDVGMAILTKENQAELMGLLNS